MVKCLSWFARHCINSTQAGLVPTMEPMSTTSMGSLSPQHLVSLSVWFGSSQVYKKNIHFSYNYIKRLIKNILIHTHKTKVPLTLTFKRLNIYSRQMFCISEKITLTIITHLWKCTVVPYVTFVWENVRYISQLAFLHILLDRV